MSPIAITHAEILDALVTASTAPEDARSMLELQAQYGLGKARLTQALKAIAAEGRLTIYRVLRPSIDGANRSVPLYAIAPKRRKSK